VSGDGTTPNPGSDRRRSLSELIAVERAAERLIDVPDRVDLVEMLAEIGSAAGRHDLTDQLFVDALLARSAESVRRREAGQLATALEILHHEATGAGPVVSRSAWPAIGRLIARFAVALSLVIGVVTLFRVPGRRAEAAAFLDAAIEALATRMYRTYTVTVEHASGAPATVGSLAVSGGRRFAVDWPSAIGRFEAGSDGFQRWIVPPVGPVLVSPEAVDRDTVEGDAAEGRVARLEYLSLVAILERVKARYRVSFADGIPPRDGGEVRMVASHASAPLPGEPERIEIVIAADGAVIRRAVLHFPPLEVPTGPRRIEFALVATREPRPTDDTLFRHDSHHLPDRPLLTVPFVP